MFSLAYKLGNFGGKQRSRAFRNREMDNMD
jgi:hypothetical protein